MIDLVLQTKIGDVDFPLLASGGAPRTGPGIVSQAIETLEPRLAVRVGDRLVTTRELVLFAAGAIVFLRFLRR